MKRASDKKVVEGGGGAVRMRSATLRDEVTEEAGHWLVAGPSGIRHRHRAPPTVRRSRSARSRVLHTL